MNQVELNVENLGTMGTVFASMLNGLGVLQLKTKVNTSVLEVAESGKMKLRPLEFNKPISKSVSKQKAHYYNLTVTEEDIKAGFVVHVKSPSSRFKVLKLDKMPSAAGKEPIIDIAIQADSELCENSNMAGIFFFDFSTYSVGPPPSAMTAKEDPESILFRRLDRLERRHTARILPGDHVFAVYGDNFLKSSTYTIEVLRQPDFEDTCSKIKVLEDELLKRKEILAKFETTFRAAKKSYEDQLQRFHGELQLLERVMLARDRLYAKLKVQGGEGGQGSATTSGGGASGGTTSGLGKLFGFG